MLKKVCKRGFTIIELLIYMVAFSGFTILLFSFLITTHKNIFKEFCKNEKIIKNSTALELLERDLISASTNIVNWDVKNFVFNQQIMDKNGNAVNCSVGWKSGVIGLKRFEGEYNFLLKKWNKKITSVVANYIVGFNLELIVNKKTKLIDSVLVTLGQNKKNINLRNKIV